eukprot:329935-Amorphochlora_amoeboformis.AAC.1
MSNLEVAQYLLENGLKYAEGVIFLNEDDDKMVYVRSTGRVVRLDQCGIPKSRRFAFYDQIHTVFSLALSHTNHSPLGVKNLSPQYSASQPYLSSWIQCEDSLIISLTSCFIVDRSRYPTCEQCCGRADSREGYG